jgi:hypothetical protein
MNLIQLKDTPPWEWPEGAGKFLLRALQDPNARNEDRATAAELAGDCIVVNDELVDVLLGLVVSPSAAQPVREAAAIALGPVLELGDVDGFDIPGEVPISEKTFQKIQKMFADVYRDADVPGDVQRRVLEASVRAPQDWHTGAVRAAYQSGDLLWMLTAVFCMQHIQGFEPQILQALKSSDEKIHLEAVRAAGDMEVGEAWAHVAELASSKATEKNLRLTAIEALPFLKPKKSLPVLHELTDSDDEDIVEAAYEAIAMCGEDDGIG